MKPSVANRINKWNTILLWRCVFNKHVMHTVLCGTWHFSCVAENIWIGPKLFWCLGIAYWGWKPHQEVHPVKCFQFLVWDFSSRNCNAICACYEVWETDRMRIIKCQLLVTPKTMILRFPFCFPSALTRPDLGLIIFQEIWEGHSPMMSDCPTPSIRISWKSKEIKYAAIIHELHLASI